MSGKTAVITGGSLGIGFATAEALHARGGAVCITGRKPELLAAAADALGGGDRVLTVTGHAGDREHQQDTIRRVVERFGSLDVLVNGVGINTFVGPMMEIDLALARKTLDANVVYALAWTQEAHRAWMGEHGGAVVNLASAGGLRATQGLGMYCVSKAAMIHLTEQLALELAPGIRVNAVAPATVKTRFAGTVWESEEAKIAESYPLARLGDPGDVGAAIAFLAGDDAAWITGETIALDGGLILTTAATPPLS